MVHSRRNSVWSKGFIYLLVALFVILFYTLSSTRPRRVKIDKSRVVYRKFAESDPEPFPTHSRLSEVQTNGLKNQPEPADPEPSELKRSTSKAEVAAIQKAIQTTLAPAVKAALEAKTTKAVQSTLATTVTSTPKAPTSTIASKLIPLPSKAPIDARVVEFFKKHAPARKAMFETALNKANPSVADLLLSIVPEAHCPDLAKVGGSTEGGKWLCNPWAIPKNGIVYTVGYHNSTSFEMDLRALADMTVQIVIVDSVPVNSTSLLELTAMNVQFMHAKIEDKTNATSTPPHYTVVDLMNKTGHKQFEILNMDYEGVEHTILTQFLATKTVCQVLVQIHQLPKTAALMRKIANAGFLLQNYEINPFSGGSGLTDYSYIHESCLEKYGATKLANYLKE